MARPSAVLALLALVLSGAGLAGCGGSAGSTAGGPGTGDPSTSAGCQSTAAVKPYPGQQPGDCVGYSAFHFIVRVDGYEVLMGNWKRYTEDQGRRFICAGVNVENLASDAQAVSAGQFRLRTPAGAVETGQAAPSNGLATRRLDNGVQQGGGVCWPDPGAGGLYVGSFEPGTGEPRGVWTVTFLAG